ncbi:heme ABC transporter ATP-binding protein [Zwartia sp.]|uniref:heme ABC transporter ATP-binding protein n=1 Tax=Zwartia sp. TaxID=2978004 RepID=UPI003BB0F1B6
MTFEINQLSLVRGHRHVLKNVTMSLRAGELVGVLGANGAGKSSLLAAMAGELNESVATGEIRLGGLSIAQLSAHEQATRRAVLPQQPSLSFELSVQEVIQMGAYPFLQATSSEVQAWSQQALLETDLLAHAQSRYTALSGGEQQRVQLARVFVQCLAMIHAQNEAYLLLDEPLSSLDPKHQVQFMKGLAQLVRTQQIGVMLVLHDLNIAAQYCHRLLLLGGGEIIAQGTPADVMTPTALKRAFDLDFTVVPHPLDGNRLLILT